MRKRNRDDYILEEMLVDAQATHRCEVEGDTKFAEFARVDRKELSIGRIDGWLDDLDRQGTPHD